MMTEKDPLESVLEARELEDKLDAELTLAKQEREKREKVLIERMDLTETKSLKINTNRGLVLAVRKENLYVSCKKDFQDQLILWIDEACGRPDMIKRVIHNKTLESFIKQRIKEGETIPEYIQLFPKPVLAISKGE